MEGKDSIVNAILNSAAEEANQIVKKAEENAKKIIDEATVEANEFLSTQKKLCQQDCESIIRNKQTLSNLDTRKSILNTKQKIIGKIYLEAEKKLMNLNKKDYLNLIEKLISENAENDANIVISKKAPISIEDVEKLKIVSIKNLKVLASDEFNGGIIIEEKICNKNLTFETIIEEIRSITEAEIAGKLFNE